MSRQLRRVPKGWKHPQTDYGKYIPLYDRGYLDALNEWLAGHNAWEAGKDPSREKSGCRYYAEWNGDAPDVESYRPDWSEEPTWYQLYEEVSEGTPITPPFPTKEALVHWLKNNKDFWGHTWTPAQAEAWLTLEYVPSATFSGTELRTAEQTAGDWAADDKTPETLPSESSPQLAGDTDVKDAE